MTDLSSSDWLERWQSSGDEEALEALLRTEVEILKRRLAKGAPGAPRDATREDVAQDAVLRLLHASPAPQFPSKAALRAYLWKAARNLLVDRLRSAGRGTMQLDTATSQSLQRSPETAGSFDRIDREDLGDALELVVNLLREDDREILRLVYFEGRTIEEAGKALGLERPVANTRLVRARLRLAEKLADWRELMD